MNKLITIVACLTATALLHTQTTIFVTPTGTGDGTSWATACDLEKAVADASAPLSDRAEIWVQKGTYYPTKMLVIPDSVKIYGGFFGIETALSQRDFVANPTIVDAQQKFGSVFRLENAAVIDGFTIQNGSAQGNPYKNGGGVWANENTIIENCIIKNNTAMLNGGGVYALGEVKIINSTLEDNIATGGGKNIFGNCQTIITNRDATFATMQISSDCNLNTPGWGTSLGTISFKSSNTWTIGGRTWSDVVYASNCNKTAYSGGVAGSYNADCRANSNRAAYGDLFTWCAVIRFQNQLCPGEWRVPTAREFRELNLALGGTDVGANLYYQNTTMVKKFLNTWGGTYGGRVANTSGALAGQGTYGQYWSQTESPQGGGYALFYTSTGAIYSWEDGDEKEGHPVRCVR